MNQQGAVAASDVPNFDTVVLPSDGSPESLAALPTALALCKLFDAQLLILSVVARADDTSTLREHAEHAAGNATVEVTVSDDPAQVIVDRRAELPAAVVCMSTRGRGRVAGSFLGSVARSVVQRSTGPLVVVGPQADRPGWLTGRPRRRPPNWPEPLSTGVLVACVDGSSDSEDVLPVAARWASALEMSMTIVTVAEETAVDVSGERRNRFGPSNPQQYVNELASQWQDTRLATVGAVVADPIGVASGLRSYQAAQPVGLVALTTHARTGLARLRFGATAAEIVATATSPVLVVPVTGP